MKFTITIFVDYIFGRFLFFWMTELRTVIIWEELWLQYFDELRGESFSFRNFFDERIKLFSSGVECEERLILLFEMFEVRCWFFFPFFSLSFFLYFNYLSVGKRLRLLEPDAWCKIVSQGNILFREKYRKKKKNGGDVSRHSCLPLMLFSCVFHFTDHALFNLKQSAVQLIK